MALPPAEVAAEELRKDGIRRTGTVDLRSFDEGVVVTLGATIRPSDIAKDGDYYLDVAGVSPPPGFPGVPVAFAFPEDVFDKYFIPAIIVRRDDLSADMVRWHPGLEQYRAPAKGARLLTAVTPAGVKQGWDKLETLPQAEPLDLMYTISIVAKHRTGIGGRHEVNAVFRHVMSVYQAYSTVQVTDSIGDVRLYQAFREGVAVLDDLPEVGGRVVGFAVTLRVSAELDFVDPTSTGDAGTGSTVVTQMPSVKMTPKVR